MSIISIDIGGTAIKAGFFDENGRLLSVSEHLTEAWNGVEALLDKLCSIVKSFDNVECVGISSTGQVNPKEGSIVFGTEALPGYTGTPLKQILQQRLGIPITVDNDVNSAAIGELHYGAGRELNDFICITYGTGIGGAIVIDKKIYYGLRGISGEFGHMMTHASGTKCVCGRYGCYEMYGSTNALIRRIKNATGKSMNGREIFSEFDNPFIRAEIDSWINEIVYGLVSLTHVFNPGHFILGGGILNEQYVLNSIDYKLNRCVIPSYSGIIVKRAEIGNNAGVLGAFYNASSTLLKQNQK